MKDLVIADQVVTNDGLATLAATNLRRHTRLANLLALVIEEVALNQPVTLCTGQT
jgi:hypothetical protein